MKDPVIISVGGGKGGVGKSTITTNIGAVLANKGFSVGYIDADLGGANLHLCMGIKRPQAGLQDYIKGKYKQLSDVAVETVIPNTWLISGASSIVELANPNFAQKQKIINNLKKMEADYILVDLGAGSDYHVTDFFAAFPFGIVVIDSFPTSVENAYVFLKNGIIRSLVNLFKGNKDLQNRIKSFSDPVSKKGFATVEQLLNNLKADYPNETVTIQNWLNSRRTFLILNMVRNGEDVRIGTRFAELVKKYLSISLHYIGYILYSTEVKQSIREMRPFILNPQNSKTKECFTAVAENLVKVTQKR
ncbi:MAG: P-loop NTPase [Fibrobacter sp.]|nr:P-loop NTPase [Fibrobacter sp.]